MSAKTLTVNYEEPLKLMKDLKGLGATNASSARNKNLTGPDTIRKVIASYNKKKVDGKIPATYEVIYGRASSSDRNFKNKEEQKIITGEKLDNKFVCDRHRYRLWKNLCLL